MAAAKLAIWLERNDIPLPNRAQKTATSSSGAGAAAKRRFSVSLF